MRDLPDLALLLRSTASTAAAELLLLLLPLLRPLLLKVPDDDAPVEFRSSLRAVSAALSCSRSEARMLPLLRLTFRLNPRTSGSCVRLLLRRPLQLMSSPGSGDPLVAEARFCKLLLPPASACLGRSFGRSG